MQQGSKIQSMARKDPEIFIKGMDKIIKRDLEKHKGLLARSKLELDSYKLSRSQLIKRKKHYVSLINNSKYNDDSLQRSVEMIAIDIKQMSDKVKLSNDAIDHHTLIVDTLTKQLEEYYSLAERAANHAVRN